MSIPALPAVSLLRYAELMRIPLCGFFGAYCGCPRGCKSTWTQDERNEIEFYLNWAQSLMEQELHYPLTPRWHHETLDTSAQRLVLNNGMLMAMGVVSEMRMDAVAINTNVNPIPVSVPYLGAVQAWQVRVFVAGTEREIAVSGVRTDGANLIFEIERCQLVRADLLDTCADVAPLCDDDIYESAIDIVILTNQTHPQAEIGCGERCSCCGTCACALDVRSAAMCIDNRRIGAVHWELAEWDETAQCYLTACGCSDCVAKQVTVHYLAGMTSLPLAAEMAVIGLAHALMPEKQCQCQSLPQAQLDRRQMGVISQSGDGLPVRRGMSDPLWGFARGAVIAWEWVLKNRIGQGL